VPLVVAVVEVRDGGEGDREIRDGGETAARRATENDGGVMVARGKMTEVDASSKICREEITGSLEEDGREENEWWRRTDHARR
jgi:hypothetical protein